MKRLILSAFFAAVLAAPAWAGYDEGRAAYDAGDYPTALLEWRPLADAGDAAAQYGIGVMYYRGEGVVPDAAEALRLFRLAAAQNYAKAQYNLGVMYQNGQSVPQDYAEAMRWYQLAAAQNYPSASLNIGVMYFQGRGVTQDYAEAARWFRAAATQGSAMAAFNIGAMHQSGEGLPRDPAAAIRRFRQAAAMGLPRAMNRLGTLYRDGIDVPADPVQAYAWYSLAEQSARFEVPKKQIAALRDDVGARLTPQQLAQAQELARLWASNPAAMMGPAPGQVPATAAAAPAAPLSPRDLATQVQQLLAALGYDPGPADGLPGARTRDAISKFETEHGLPVTGAVSPDILAALQQARTATQ